MAQKPLRNKFLPYVMFNLFSKGLLRGNFFWLTLGIGTSALKIIGRILNRRIGGKVFTDELPLNRSIRISAQSSIGKNR
jgi:hypothetical protein